MATKKTLFVAFIMFFSAFTVGCVAVAVAQEPTPQPVETWFSWKALIVYMAVGAFFGVLHDLNDGKGVVILPHKINGGVWDLGIITPALFGGAAGFIALAVSTVPFVSALFPTMDGDLPGILAAVFAGYFYSKTIEVALSKLSAPTPATP